MPALTTRSPPTRTRPNPPIFQTKPPSYLCAIKNAFSNSIVGYSIDFRMKSRLATTALHGAVARRGEVAGCILHSDRGSYLRSRRFVRVLSRHEMVGSMGRIGAAGDNAAMESFCSPDLQDRESALPLGHLLSSTEGRGLASCCPHSPGGCVSTQ